MNLQILFQWHKLLHIILPIIIIAALQKRLGLVRTCAIVFMTGLFKEIRDIVIIKDPLLESAMDIILNIIGMNLNISIATSRYVRS
ncbi:hypothetical protein ACJDU8_01915 [Clostridium sp. WILCCON 0269]|uniref:Uncharacterized protein n=1 Tax=Candidatus Clostridium eludens TaxID=3381663 RepID=A0ABW8SF03_9CLOT